VNVAVTVQVATLDTPQLDTAEGVTVSCVAPVPTVILVVVLNGVKDCPCVVVTYPPAGNVIEYAPVDVEPEATRNCHLPKFAASQVFE
jgi:hypothetical protein